MKTGAGSAPRRKTPRLLCEGIVFKYFRSNRDLRSVCPLLKMRFDEDDYSEITNFLRGVNQKNRLDELINEGHTARFDIDTVNIQYFNTVQLALHAIELIRNFGKSLPIEDPTKVKPEHVQSVMKNLPEIVSYASKQFEIHHTNIKSELQNLNGFSSLTESEKGIKLVGIRIAFRPYENFCKSFTQFLIGNKSNFY